MNECRKEEWNKIARKKPRWNINNPWKVHIKNYTSKNIRAPDIPWIGKKKQNKKQTHKKEKKNHWTQSTFC